MDFVLYVTDVTYHQSRQTLHHAAPHSKHEHIDIRYVGDQDGTVQNNESTGEKHKNGQYSANCIANGRLRSCRGMRHRR